MGTTTMVSTKSCEEKLQLCELKVELQRRELESRRIDLDRATYLLRAVYRKHVNSDDSIDWKDLEEEITAQLRDMAGHSGWVTQVSLEMGGGLFPPRLPDAKI